MRSKCISLFGIVLISLSFFISLHSAYAGGSMVSGVAPRAQSMQNAFTAVADDPSAIFYNPAGLTQVKGTEFDFGAMVTFPSLKYENSTAGTTSKSTKINYSGNFFFSTDAVEPVTLGFGAYVPAGKSNSFTANTAVSSLANDVTIMRIDFVPTVAIDLGQYLSFGVGFVGSYVTMSSHALGFNESGTGYGFTGNAGFLLKPSRNFKAGLTFRGPMSVTASGSGTFGAQTGNFTSDYRFPGTVAFGLAWQIIDKLLVAFDFDIEMWGWISEVKRNYSNPILNAIGTTVLDCDNSFNIRFGVMYKPWKNSELKAGYSYVAAAYPSATLVPAQADYNINSFSVGYSHSLKHFRIDVGYKLDYAPARTGTNAMFPGRFSAFANSVVAGFAYKFGID